MTPPTVAVRTERGVLHMAVLRGRRYETACWRTFTLARAAVVWEGRDRLGRKRAVVAWRNELICQDCEHLRLRGRQFLEAHTPLGGR